MLWGRGELKWAQSSIGGSPALEVDVFERAHELAAALKVQLCELSRIVQLWWLSASRPKSVAISAAR